MSKILLVEDDTTLRNLFGSILKSGGYEVETAKNGTEGLALMLKGGYQLILLDIMMPGKDGITALTEYRNASPQQPNGPVVMMTNLVGDDVTERALKAGAVACLNKAEIGSHDFLAAITPWIHS